MANYTKKGDKMPKGKPFVKGDERAGRPKDSPEVKAIKKMKKGEFLLLCHRFINMSLDELNSFQGTVLEEMLAKQARDAVTRGETLKVEFFTDRLFGKVQDLLKVDAVTTGDVTIFDGKVLKEKLKKIRSDVI
jgi:hypothetical protein